jgi:SEC-C motif
MMTKIGRNDLCFCGSGKKYKYCHIDREDDVPLKLDDAIKASNQAQKKICFHPNASKSTCKGKIIKAHSIQKNGGLSKIARSGHVYMLDYSLTALHNKGGQPTYNLIGINHATTFTGFCNYHDTTTFLPIEQHPFVSSQESAFLLSYRGICREYFAKRYELEMNLSMQDGDRGKSIENQIRYQEYIKQYSIGVKAGFSDVEHHKRIYDDKLIHRDYSDVSFYTIIFDRVPDFMCSSAFILEMDFDGKILQTTKDYLRLNIPLAQCTFSLIGTDTGGAAVFSWLGENPHGVKLIQSLDSKSDDAIIHAVLRFTFEYFENVAISPTWWEKLSESEKSILKQRATSGVAFNKLRPVTSLMDDGLRVIDWKVVRRDKKILH